MSMIDQDIYNAVVSMHNQIMNFKIRPIHYVVDNFFYYYNLTIDYKLVDFPRPYLRFSKLFGVPNFESNYRAYSLIDELYDENATSAISLTKNMEIFHNHNGDLIGIDIDTNATDVVKVLRIEFMPNFYVELAKVCIEFMSPNNATIIRSLKIHYSNDKTMKILTSNKTNLYCNNYEMKGYSIYKFNVFPNTCGKLCGCLQKT